eukprot:TRINITY_DN93431_c0_g1_i1.p1 TRINITY_DN93431_c0_g1~~TRINITY_DN93431_c0_g1_i1.p1  ORF type:complete len:429 (-),score=56.17 TRINITY_DN93431_c0_g1_i1:86-1306(-)
MATLDNLRQMMSASRSKPKAKELADFSTDIGRQYFGFGQDSTEDSTGFYEGEFKIRLRHGHGILRAPDSGSSYQGQFQNDVFHGGGTQTRWDGSTYSGQWRNGSKHGEGVLTAEADFIPAISMKKKSSMGQDSDGEQKELTYEGFWENGKRHGRGKQTYANGDSYKGSFWNGQPSGRGTYKYADGSEHYGVWAGGRHHGKTLLSTDDHKRERLTFNLGILVQRDILKPGDPASVAADWAMTCAKAVHEQSWAEMKRDTFFPCEPPFAKHLSVKDSTIMDLSAPSIRKRSLQSSPPVASDRMPGVEEMSACDSTEADRLLRSLVDDLAVGDPLQEPMSPSQQEDGAFSFGQISCCESTEADDEVSKVIAVRGNDWTPRDVHAPSMPSVLPDSWQTPHSDFRSPSRLG